MRHFFLILSLSLTALPAIAQKQKQQQQPIPVPKERLIQPVVIDSNSAEEPYRGPVVVEAPVPEGEIYTATQQMPEFPGGIPALTAYLSRNLVYPVKAQEAGIQGRVIVRFIVDNEGRLSDVKVVRGIGGGCDQEAVRVIKSMPKWKPAKQNGKAVKVYYNQPVSFRLIEDEPAPKKQK